jgi:hypothetical protein
MRHGMLGLVLLALLGVTGVPAQAVDCSPVSTYTITELEGIGSLFPITRAVAIAPDGSAAGSSLDDSLVSHAVRWDKSGNATNLFRQQRGPRGATSGRAVDVNASGVAVGWTTDFHG